MGGPSPCASCKLRRRRCPTDCIFAPYFPSDDPQKFAVVHKVFGTSKVRKRFQGLPVHQRGHAVSSLVYAANAWLRDPVYGCVGRISLLEKQVSELQKKLGVALAQIPCTANDKAVKDGKGKEPIEIETAQEKEPYVPAAAGEMKREPAEKTFDLNELPSDEDEGIMA